MSTAEDFSEIQAELLKQLRPRVVKDVPGQPKRIDCMTQIPSPDQSLLRKNIEKHEPAPLEEHRPSEGEIVMLSGAVRKDN